LTRPSRKELAAIRRAGNRAYQQALAAATRIETALDTVQATEPSVNDGSREDESQHTTETSNRAPKRNRANGSNTNPTTNSTMAIRRHPRAATNNINLNLSRLSAQSVRRQDSSSTDSSTNQADTEMSEEGVSC
jgi:hypothetical protein